MIKFNVRKLYKAASILGLIGTAVASVAAIKTGVFDSPAAIREFVQAGGIFAPLLFVVIQVIQVVIPIIPGGVTLLAGVIIFGAFWGFIYNYVGIVIGSMIAFQMVRKLGRPFLQSAFSMHYDKYIGWLDKGKGFDRMFALAILLPIAPDDFLCMLAGLTKMSFKKLTVILILCKPPTIMVYSILLSTVTAWMTSLFHF